VPELAQRDELEPLLREVRTIAVLGISSAPSRAGHFVPAYLHEHGYQIIGVNPNLRGAQLFGRPVVSTLDEIEEPIDLVNVFRRPAALAGHQAELLALAPRAIWLQPGAVHAGVARALSSAGIAVVSGRCIMVDHRRWVG